MQAARGLPSRLHRAAGHGRHVTASARLKPASPPPNMALMVVDGVLLMLVCEALNQVGAKEPIYEKALPPMALGGIMFPIFARLDAYLPAMPKANASALGKRVVLVNALYLSLPLIAHGVVQPEASNGGPPNLPSSKGAMNSLEAGPARMSYKATFAALLGVSTFLGVWGSYFAAHSVPRNIARRATFLVTLAITLCTSGHRRVQCCRLRRCVENGSHAKRAAGAVPNAVSFACVVKLQKLHIDFRYWLSRSTGRCVRAVPWRQLKGGLGMGSSNVIAPTEISGSRRPHPRPSRNNLSFRVVFRLRSSGRDGFRDAPIPFGAVLIAAMQLPPPGPTSRRQQSVLGIRIIRTLPCGVYQNTKCGEEKARSKGRSFRRPRLYRPFSTHHHIMKGPRASCEGYLTFRTSPYSPPPMIRSYSMLVGTCFYYYNTQEDAEVMMRLKGEVDVIGAQEWDGKGNMHIYANGFMFVTAQNKVFYAYADTPMDKEKWLRAMQTAVMTTVPGLSTLGATSLSNHHELGSPSSSTELDIHGKCLRCPPEDLLAAGLPKMRCANCEGSFCERHSLQRIPLPQKGLYYAQRVCDDCYYAQLLVNYLKAMNQRLASRMCVYPKPLNINGPIELIMPMGPSHTPATTIALDLFKQGAITAEELEELLMADRRYLDQTTEQPEIPLDIKILALHREFRSKSFTVSRAIVLLHQHLDADPLIFKPIVEQLLHFSFAKINQVEFYWPQIVHAYLNVPVFEFEKLFWMDELILSICSRSIHLALLLIWQLRGALEDSKDLAAPLRTQSQFARVVRLMVEIEVQVIGASHHEVLQQSSVKHALPTFTKDQLALVHKLMDDMASYRVEATAAAAAVPVDASSDAQYADFSGFQQHLLKPKEMPPPLPIGGVRDDGKPEPLQRRRTMSMAEKSVLATFYAEECEFVEQITRIAEALRFVPMAERKPMLAKHLESFQLRPNAYIPLVKAADPIEQVLRLPHKEGTAFSTKARVPIMLIFEVVRGSNSSLQITSPGSNRALVTPAAAPVAPLYEVDEEVRHLINRQSIDEPAPAPTPLAGTAPVVSDDDDDDDTDAPVAGAAGNSSMELELASMHLSDEVIAMERDRKKDLEAAFGESWHSKRERIRQSSPHGHLPGWDIVSMIGKSNDDMRQEVFTLQLIQRFLEIFKAANLPIWLKVYRIIATSASAGLVETLTDAISLDGLKKRDGYVSLAHHFEKSYGTAERFAAAQAKFIQSMAGYSLVSYFLQIKDRHNGNIMLDNEGHIIHIDYGFLLGIAPGGSFSIETAPFKLTTEMVDTMGGPDSEGFKEYVTLCTRGFLALQPHADELCELVAIMAQNSPYPCFAGKDVASVLSRFRSRFKVAMSKHEVVGHMLYLIRKSHGNYSTRQYDNFQRMTNGIYP
ncbi:phosphatidyl inositol kinase (PIK-G1) [Achlya hypogyna]|uniref:1-phosphatidylinositol 4-kinase n=1 Tax=Achlya hypogyna TaxID=1202772 RepID=A0A1V9YGF6_ACHHY|nr:phosphatidyl inositol kinase (PIK-G1) [Achlya hypogyna]